MLSDYLKLIRSFNMPLTGVAPLLGALAMWPVSQLSLLQLFVLFIIGCCSHIYGFVLNDYLDVNVDKECRELSERPLVSSKIAPRTALVVAFSALVFSWILTLLFFNTFTQWVLLFSIILIADFLATAYNFTSKKFPGMDFLVAGAILFLIFFGSCSVHSATSELNVEFPLIHFRLQSVSFNLAPLAIVVAFIGFTQVLYMNMVNGGLKDIDHDSDASAKTAAVALGVKVEQGALRISTGFKSCAYSIFLIHTVLIFLPFLILNLNYHYTQLLLLFIFVLIEFYFVSKMLKMNKFDRQEVRKTIGLHVIFMYALAPIMLSSINLKFILLAFVPPLGFVISNLLLHKTALKPQTM